MHHSYRNKTINFKNYNQDETTQDSESLKVY